MSATVPETQANTVIQLEKSFSPKSPESLRSLEVIVGYKSTPSLDSDKKKPVDEQVWIRVLDVVTRDEWSLGFVPGTCSSSALSSRMNFDLRMAYDATMAALEGSNEWITIKSIELGDVNGFFEIDCTLPGFTTFPLVWTLTKKTKTEQERTLEMVAQLWKTHALFLPK